MRHLCLKLHAFSRAMRHFPEREVISFAWPSYEELGIIYWLVHRLTIWMMTCPPSCSEYGCLYLQLVAVTYERWPICDPSLIGRWIACKINSSVWCKQPGPPSWATSEWTRASWALTAHMPNNFDQSPIQTHSLFVWKCGSYQIFWWNL